MSARVHPSACVHDGAEIADDVEIGPFCEVGAGVVLEAGVQLRARASVIGNTRIGARTQIHEGATLGGAPQVKGLVPGSDSRLEIGADCVFRECVTIHTGTPKDAGTTRIGTHCYFMAYSHAGHDCQVGDGCMLANNVAMAGHCRLGPGVNIGGAAAIHQFVEMGEGAMVGGGAILVDDVIPFGLVTGNRARLNGLNLVGLKRSGADKTEINALRAAYRDLFHAEGNFSERVASLARRDPDDPRVIAVLDFIRRERRRPLCRPEAS
ncbi:MAG: acyl-ACP--UDP-N-acetylglucosamine O-acyltransferase [Alphaproteobacteria bacterium]|jgi:UDP-N-acetylglucosamine acyltransferase|nr:acyl-ACP--UDP-N-acetylglucosamine O-acyltransferase [Alphaproteobacteria bacterium]